MTPKSKLLTESRLLKYHGDEVKNYFQVALVLLLVIIFLAFAIKPSITTYVTEKKKIKEYEEIERQMDEKILNIRTIRSNYNKYEDEILLLDKAIPSSPSEGKLLTNLSFIGAKNKIKILSISFGTRNENNLGILTLDITAKGDYQHFTAFLKDTNNLLRIINVKHLSIRPENTNKKNQITATIKAESYFEID